MIKYLVSKNGSLKKGIGFDYKIPSKNEFIWLFLISPTADELSRVSADFKLVKRQFEVFSKEKHSVRYSMDPFQFVIVDYFLEGGKVDSAHLLFTIKDNILILVSNKNTKYFHDLFEDICDNIKNKNQKIKSIGRVLHLFLQFDIEENYDVLEKTEDDIRVLEEKVSNFEGTISSSAKDIIKFKRKLSTMGRRFWASTKIIFLLKAGYTNVKLDRETSKLLVDVHDTFLHQMDIVSTQKEMLSDVMNIYSTSINNRLALISNELNQIMRKMTAFALILLLPTLLASAYGMNFAHIPLSENPYGFHILTAAMGTIVIALIYMFRKNNWF